MNLHGCFKMFTSRIVDDLKHKELLPLKVLFFVHASTLFVLYPYLTIHMRELGINVEETAIMSAVTPIIAIVMPPLAGMVADKIGNFKILLALFSSLGGAASLLLLTVPVGRLQVTYPDHVILDMGCTGVDAIDVDGVGFLELGLAEDIPCEQSLNLQSLSGRTTQLNPRFESCGFVCTAIDSPLEDLPDFMKPDQVSDSEPELTVDAMLKARSYSVQIQNLNNKNTKVYHYNLTREEVPAQKTKNDALSHRFLKHNPFFLTAIRRLSKNKYYLPTTGMYNFTCRNDGHPEEMSDNREFLPTSRSFRLKRNDNETETETVDVDHFRFSDTYHCYFGDTTDVTHAADDFTPSFKNFYGTKLTAGNDENNNLSDGSRLKVLEFNWDHNNNTKKHINVSCIDSFTQRNEEVTATLHLHNPDNNLEVMHSVDLAKCESRCLMTVPRSGVCNNFQKEIVYDPQLTFWLYLVIRVFIGMIGGTAFAMFEGAVIAILREQKADYGLQRIYASIGGMISSPLSGLLIDYASSGKGYTDFRPAFYLYAGLKIIGGILMLTLNLEFKSGAKNVISDVMKVLKNAEIIALLLACFVLGTAWGYIESFLFWLLQDLGGSRSLMGITITVGGIAGIPLLVLSGPIIDKIGHANVLFIGFVFYAVRLVGYSIIYNPWHCLIFEAMESITSSLSFTAAVTYAAKLSTTTTDSSVQGLLGGLYFGVGKGAGSLVGGYMMKALGTRPTYQIFSGFTLFFGCVYFLVNRFYLRHQVRENDNEICKKEPKQIKDNYVDIDLKTIDKQNGQAKMKEDEAKEMKKEKTPVMKTKQDGGDKVGSYDNEAFEADDKKSPRQ